MAIRIERCDAVATIVIDRPEARNAVDGPAALALAEAFREVEGDDGDQNAPGFREINVIQHSPFLLCCLNRESDRRSRKYDS